MKTITIRSNDKGLVIASAQDRGGRKDYPPIHQKGIERELMKIHEACKGASNYLGASVYLEDQDYYEPVDSFEVPGASISRGQRKVTDTSTTSNIIPKGWEEHIVIKYKPTTRNARPIGDALKALNIRVDIKDIQKMMKKNNGLAYVFNGKVYNEYMDEHSF